MLRGIHIFAAAALCISSCAVAATHSIGSVTGHVDGIVKIDNYSVKGSGTVFDGSVVETGPTVTSTADIRLWNDSVITLEADSLGTVYRDHFVLQRGRIKLGSSTSFRVEVNDLVVTQSESRSSGLVSIEPENTVAVEANTGNLEVRGSTGRLVAQVHPGSPLAFSPVRGEPSPAFSAKGKVITDKGHYYLATDETGVKYEMKGGNVQNFVGSHVATAGVLDPSAAQENGAEATVRASSIADLGRFGFGQSNQSLSLVDGLRISPRPESTIIKKCLSVSINGQTESLCCTGGPTPEFCCPGPKQFSSGLCCVSGAPGSMCHHSN